MTNPSMDPAFAALAKHSRAVLRDAKSVREAISFARQEAETGLLDLDLEVEERYVIHSDTEIAQIPVRIYRNRKVTGPLPVLLYLHGGGFFCGDRLSEEAQCSYYALNAQCAVVSLTYRLAPEDPFPAALTDCYRVLEFLWSESSELNFDRDFIAVGGSSAGATLAAAISLLARDREGPKVCFQMLLVPALDERLDTPSARQFTDVPDFARPEAEIMWKWYLGEEVREVSCYAAPARATDLARLPATYVLCAGLDPLRDEGLEYARRLAEAGIAVELHLVPSIPHGFASISNAAISQRLLKEQADVLRSAFARL